MTTFQRPGIYLTEQLSGPNTPTTTTSPSAAAFIGEHWRGPTGISIQCNSWLDFIRYFGGFNPSQTATQTLTNPYLAFSVYAFFSNGGQTCYVQRITNSLTTGGNTAGSTASCILYDIQSTSHAALTLYGWNPNSFTNASPPATSACNPGTWGNGATGGLYVDVITNTTTGRFTLNIYYGGNTAQYMVESWSDLSMLTSDARYAPTVINADTTGSSYVTVVDNLPVDAAPGNAPNATNTGTPNPKAFTGGTDPTSSASCPTNTDWQNALSYGNALAGLDKVADIVNLNLPAVTDKTILGYAQSYASAGTGRAGTFLVVDTPAAYTPANAVNWATTSSPLAASQNTAVYYPWVNANNPASTNLQSVITLPPGGFVLGQMAVMDARSGVWTAPAGTSTILRGVVSAERQLSTGDLNALNTGYVNAIRTLPNGQVVIWGTRTLQAGYATMYVPVRRTLNYIETTLTNLLGFAVFQPNDSVLWTQISATCNKFLSSLWGQNAFPGSNSSQAYYVVCDATNNTPSTIAQGIVNTTVGVALQYPAEFINLTISQFQSSGTVTVTSTNS
jgi:hypothetical protein